MASMYCCERFEKPASVNRQPANGRARSVRTPENIDAVNDLVSMPCRSLKKSDLLCKGMSSDFFILQQDSAPAHRAKDTIELLQRETPSFIGPELWPTKFTKPQSMQLTTEFLV